MAILEKDSCWVFIVFLLMLWSDFSSLTHLPTQRASLTTCQSVCNMFVITNNYKHISTLMCVNLRSYLWDFESHPTSNTDAFRTTRTTFNPKVLIFDEFGIRLKNKLSQLEALSTWGEVHQHWLLVWPETQTAVCWVKVLCLTRPFSQMSDPFGPLLHSLDHDTWLPS